MLKREIKYEDFNGETVVDTFYFNISKPELIEMEVEYEQGLGKFLQSIIDTSDHKELIKKFKEIVLLAYGEKSDDGKYFIKSDEMKNKFSQSAAYTTLFMELAQNDNAAVIFLRGVLPQDMIGQIDQDKPTSLPAPPPAPSPPVPPNS